MRSVQSFLLLLPLAGGCDALGPRETTVPWPPRADTLAANGGFRDCDLLHLTLDLRLDFDAERVSGRATSWIRAFPGGCEEVTLHAVGLEVREVVDGRGRALQYRLEEPRLVVRLAEPLSSGEEASITVAYTTRAPARGVVFVDADPRPDAFAPEIWTRGQFEDNRHWFPAWDLPNDRATVDLSARVGHDMTCVAGGELVGVEEHGGGERTFRWRMARAIPTYLVALAAGRWETYTDRAGDVPLAYHVPPGTGEAATRAALGETPEMLRFFEELLDEPFPFAKYDQAVVAGFPWAGMENASLTMLHDEILGGEEALLDLDGDPRLLVAHELAHQWFGDLVTCRGWSDLWLNEAWASYLELAWERVRAGAGSFALWLERYAERYRSRGDACRLPLALDWHSQGLAEQRAHHVYTKGPWVLHMLERRLGAEAFWAATRAYLDRHADGLVTTADLERVVFDTTGHNVEGFLEQWVELGGHPELAVSFTEVPGADGRPLLELRLRQTQEFGPTVPLFDLDLEVLVVQAGSPPARHRVAVRSRRTVARLPLEGELRDVVVDPDGDLLMDLELEKPLAMWLRQAGRSGSPVAQWRALPAVSAAAEKDPAAVEALMRLAGESAEPLLRQRAAAALSVSDPRAARTLLRLTATDTAARVRREAAAGLLDLVRGGRALDADEVQLLQRRLGREPSPATRALLQQLLESDA